MAGAGRQRVHARQDRTGRPAPRRGLALQVELLASARGAAAGNRNRPDPAGQRRHADPLPGPGVAGHRLTAAQYPGTPASAAPAPRLLARSLDRKSVVSGKSVSVRVDLGGRRILKNKKKNKT